MNEGFESDCQTIVKPSQKTGFRWRNNSVVPEITPIVDHQRPFASQTPKHEWYCDIKPWIERVNNIVFS